MKKYAFLGLVFLIALLPTCQKYQSSENVLKKQTKAKPTASNITPFQVKLPSYPVAAAHHWMDGTTSEYNLGLSGISQGYSIQDGFYPGWCTEDNYQENAGQVKLYSSYDPNLPDDIKYYRDPSIPKGQTGKLVPWDKLNFLLNHKQGSVQEVGAAIFVLLWGESAHFPTTTMVQAMLKDAEANGKGFIPRSGQFMAIVLYQDGFGDGKPPDDRARQFQDTFIEYKVP